MLIDKLFKDYGDPLEISGLRQHRGLDQSVGDPAHCGNNYHDITIASRSSNDLDGSPDAGGISNGRAAKLHHPKRPFARAGHPTPLRIAVKHGVLLNRRPLHDCGTEINGRVVAPQIEPAPLSERCHLQSGIFSVNSGPQVQFPILFCAERGTQESITRISHRNLAQDLPGMRAL